MGDEATSSACSRARLMPKTAQITEHETRRVHVRDLVPADWNPRKISQRARIAHHRGEAPDVRQ